MNTTSHAPDALGNALELVNQAFDQVQKIPGSSIVIRYIRSSYQDDPVRSAMELFLFLFAVYYLVSPAYSTKKQKQIPLTEEVRSDYSHPLSTAH
jgi:serine palmitoyltransferase